MCSLIRERNTNNPNGSPAVDDTSESYLRFVLGLSACSDKLFRFCELGTLTGIRSNIRGSDLLSVVECTVSAGF